MPLDPLIFRDPPVEFPRKDGTKLELLFTAPWQRRLWSLWRTVMELITGIDALTASIALMAGTTVTASLTFLNTLAGEASEQIAAVPGAAMGDFVQVAPVDPALIIDKGVYIGKVSAADEVTVTYINHSVFAQAPTGDFRIKVSSV